MFEFVINISATMANQPNIMLHPILLCSPATLVISILYSILFLIGICGNSSTIWFMYKFRKPLFNTADNCMIYILALCLVDFFVILTIPLSIAQMFIGNWILGTPLCIVYWTIESTAKVLSAFILTALSFDRFVGVCYPVQTCYRTKRFVVILILILTIIAFLLLLPLPLNATVEKQMLRFIHIIYGQPTQFIQLQCSMYSMSKRMFNIFTIYIFILAFCFPAILITTFYSFMIRNLFMRTRRQTHSVIPVKKIVVYTLVMASFFFICWIPYWASTLYYLISSNSPGGLSINDSFVYLMYFVHAMPYLNSAMNWILYAMLNTQFSASIATAGASSRCISRGQFCAPIGCQCICAPKSSDPSSLQTILRQKPMRQEYGVSNPKMTSMSLNLLENKTNDSVLPMMISQKGVTIVQLLTTEIILEGSMKETLL